MTMARAGAPDPAVARYTTMAVPRYTSYPTVPHFHDRVDGGVQRGWLERLDPRRPVSVYLHVPFCRELCWYCGCNMKLAARYAPVVDYIETLLEEIELVARVAPGRLRVGHLHWGGGTPTVLTPDDLERVMDTVRSRFDLEPDAEIAIESDPRTLTDAMARRIGTLGFTRASFGVQEFDPKVQQAINRIQPPEMVAASVDGLRAAGVGGINFDLIYGLPHQTVDTLLATVERCAAIGPDRLALFGYAHVPWMAKKQRLIDADALPGAAERLTQAAAAAAALEGAGYAAVGLDHFATPDDALAVAARDGTLRRNFQGYTTDPAETLIGLGATAIGRTPDGYVQNFSDTGRWAKAVREGSLPVAKGIAIDDEDRLRAAVIEALMCFGKVDTTQAGARFGRDAGWAADALRALEPMAAEGLVTAADGMVAVTGRGRPLLRVIAAAFDTYRAASQARHSVAV
ncbi:oxygen-independent coproporphyrinogen III oxidase [Bauldia sp.]|uniref:oxygen-independent coproporphyrinogen III oxidase n=1 Tax=Bauldia sp. TaxID=2575872 RepID=UPI003BAAD41B